MMFSIVDNHNEDVYVKYTVNKFSKATDWGFKQLIHKNAILYQKEKFLKPFPNAGTSNSGALTVRVKMRLDEHKHDYLKKLNDNLHYCKLLSENFSQYYYNNNANGNTTTTNDATSTAAAESSTLVLSSSASLNQSIISSSPNQVISAAAAASSSITSNSAQPQPSSSCLPSTSNLRSHSSSPNFSSSSSTSSLLNGKITSSSSSSSSSSLTNAINANSSYYDILLLVKSWANLDEKDQNNNNKNKNNSNLCTKCVCQETSDLKSQAATPPPVIKSNNKRSHAEEATNSSNVASSKRAKLSSTPINQLDVNNSNNTANNEIIKACLRCCSTTINSSPRRSSMTTDEADKEDDEKQEEKEEEEEFIEFRAHKCILAARSPVFKAMFNYRLKENLTNRVVIEDCRPEVVKAMLKYIYTAYLPDDHMRHIAVDLYIAAEKYFIESLKIKCREYLVEHLGVDSAVCTFILAELYNDSMLRKQALKFINENIDKVTQNTDWNEFMSVYPQFFTNALIRICKKDF
jgi:hypothetical protein